MTNPESDNHIRDLTSSEMNQWNERTTKVRAVEPMMEFLGWPLRSPSNRTRVTLDEVIDGEEVDYAVYRDDELKLVLDVLPELDDFNLHKKPIQKTDWYMVSDGYNYQLNVGTKDHLRKVGEFTINSLYERNNILDVIGIEGVQSGFIDSVFNQYRKLEEDRSKLESEITEDIITNSVGDEFQTLKNEEIREGSMRMADFLLRKIEGKDFDSMVENARGEEVSEEEDPDREQSNNEESNNEESNNEEKVGHTEPKIEDGKLVIVVKEKEDNIDKHFRRENPTGRIVTYSNDRPDYIAFYTKGEKRIDHIAGVDSFDLIENREDKELADKVFDIELSDVRELQDYVEDPDDDLMPIEYCNSEDLLGAETTEDIEFLEK